MGNCPTGSQLASEWAKSQYISRTFIAVSPDIEIAVLELGDRDDFTDVSGDEYFVGLVKVVERQGGLVDDGAVVGQQLDDSLASQPVQEHAVGRRCQDFLVADHEHVG